MILYFSGTGNSQFAATSIAGLIGDEAVSINQYLKSGKSVTIYSEKPLLFVAPTYAWRLPKVVEDWIMSTTFEGNRTACFILTCGDSCGNGEYYIKRMCAKKGLRFFGVESLRMPENYLAMFPTPDKEECQKIMADADIYIARYAELMRSGVPFGQDKPEVTWGERLKSGPINYLFYKFGANDKGFSVSDGCISCGKCAQRCPLDNIHMADGRPVWKGNCTHCMACIGGCPVEAIEYKNKSKGRNRYYIMNDELCRGKKAGAENMEKSVESEKKY